MIKSKMYHLDDEFKRLARAHQFHFRENELHVFYDEKNPQVMLTPEAAKQGLNFYEGYRDLIMHEKGKFGTSALFANMLRSEHIPYNIFVPMKQDMGNAALLFSRITGVKIVEILGIKIEYAGLDKRDKYLNDGTSFDAFIHYRSADGKEGGIGIEVKYTEKSYGIGGKEKEDLQGLNKSYHTITSASGYFVERLDVRRFAKEHHLRQIWRNHILGYSMIHKGDIELFHHIHLYPKGNRHFGELAIPEYKRLLSDSGKSSFIDLTYEELFQMMEEHFQSEEQKKWIDYLNKRYLFPITSQTPTSPLHQLQGAD